MKKALAVSLIVILATSVSGCGAVQQVDMMRSKAEYKECLEQNPSNINACAAKKAAFEADEKAYRGGNIRISHE